MPKLVPAVMRLVCLAGLLVGFGLPAEAGPASIYTVISTLDTPDAAAGNDVCADSNGLCTLRAAVMEANAHVGPDTITLPADTFHLTRAGAGEDLADTGDLDITSNVTLQGMGPAASIVDAGPLGDRVFDVLTGTSASLSQITLRGGTLTDGPGGGVQNWGTLTLSHVLITNNNLTGSQSQSGGGIANRLPGVLALTNSQVISNAGFSGGGIDNLGQMTISGSQVSTNTARYGGGLANDGGLVITASQVLSNTAGENMGGIYNTGQLAVSSSTIQGNRAPAYGGGLATFGSASRLTVSGSAIRDNVSAVAGGVLWPADSAPLTITTSTLSGNHAGTLGGGVYAEDAAITIIASTLLGNSAGQAGGGIFLNIGPLSLVNVTMAQNFTEGNGGGVYINGGAFDGYNVTLTDGFANADDSGGGRGGGLYGAAGTVTLRNTIAAYNRSVDNAHFVRDDDCFGAFGTFRYSLVGATTGCTFTNDQTLTGQDPLLLPLAPNGGSTLTQALGPGSPALDAADPAGCESPFGGLLVTDQRGQPRHADGNYDGLARCDMGAYEAQRLHFLPLLRR